MRLVTFIDMSYVRKCSKGFKIDYKKLVPFLQSKAETFLSNGVKRQITKAQTIVVGTIPVNVAPEDSGVTESSERFFNALRRLPCFEVHTLELDYHGYHINRDERLKSQNPSERSFFPTEKGVDSTLVVRMMELQHLHHAMDCACVVSGDQDMIPSIKSLQNSGCSVFVAGIDCGSTMGSQFNQENIWSIDLFDYKDQIERTFEFTSDNNNENQRQFAGNNNENQNRESQKKIDELMKEIESSQYMGLQSPTA